MPISRAIIVPSSNLISNRPYLLIFQPLSLMIRFTLLGMWLEIRCLIALCLSPIVRVLGHIVLMLSFSKFFWRDIGGVLLEVVRYIFTTSSLPNSWAYTFITLIPKTDNPKVFGYRSISLCNVCYKIVTKLISNRLKVILPKLISIK